VEPLVIQGNDQYPGWTVAEFCDQKIVKSRPPGRSLVLIHYAGHGGYNALAKTLFCYAGPNSKQSFRWDTIHNRVVAPNLGDDVGRLMEHADVLVILDCCHAGASLRGNDGSRTAEIMCASEEWSSAGSRKDVVSFTQQVSAVMRRMFRHR
jgi:hypothetical protein